MNLLYFTTKLVVVPFLGSLRPVPCLYYSWIFLLGYWVNWWRWYWLFAFLWLMFGFLFIICLLFGISWWSYRRSILLIAFSIFSILRNFFSLWFFSERYLLFSIYTTGFNIRLSWTIILTLLNLFFEIYQLLPNNVKLPIFLYNLSFHLVNKLLKLYILIS